METKLRKKIEDLIINITIEDTWGIDKSPEKQIENRGYERARTLYAEAKIKALKILKTLK